MIDILYITILYMRYLRDILKSNLKSVVVEWKEIGFGHVGVCVWGELHH